MSISDISNKTEQTANERPERIHFLKESNVILQKQKKKTTISNKLASQELKGKWNLCLFGCLVGTIEGNFSKTNLPDRNQDN